MHYLREYNSYMSPKTGLFSNDVWTIVAIFVRNILLNWTVLIPLLMAVLMVPRLYLATLSFPERLYPQILAGTQPDWANPLLDAVSQSTSVWPLLAYDQCRAAGHRAVLHAAQPAQRRRP